MTYAASSKKKHHVALLAPALLLLLVIAQSVSAVQNVEGVKAVPDGLFVNDSTTVTITAQVGLDATLIPTSVTLIQYNANGQPIASLGRLYDDQTHGDVLPGDNNFTTQIQVNQATPSTLFFRVSVAYKRALRRVVSELIKIDVVTKPSEQAVNNVLAMNQQASANLQTWIQQVGVNQARQMLVTSLNSQPGIQSATISSDGQTVQVTYSIGVKGAFLVNEPNTWGQPTSNKGLVFSPVSPLAENELQQVYGRLHNDTLVVPDPIKRDADITVDFIKTISQYGVISLATHGGVADGNVIFQTGEKAQTFLGIPTSHLVDWIRGRLVISGDNFWMIEPSFITAYGGRYPDSIIFLSMCHSLDNSTLTDAFLNKGAKTVFGWTESVSVSFAALTKQRMLAQMIDNKKNTGDAFNLIPHVDTGVSPNAVYGVRGALDMTLPVDLIVNGSFETGDFNGWVRGSTTGLAPYTSVITGNSIDQVFAARIGRFDQVYTGGPNGIPIPGAEPDGYDYIYQDIQVPTNPSTPIILRFSYDVQTYDAVAYDWFDAVLLDADTGAQVATLVAPAGRPGRDYGVFYDTGWQPVQYNLTPLAGRHLRILFRTQQDGFGDQTAGYVDKVTTLPPN